MQMRFSLGFAAVLVWASACGGGGVSVAEGPMPEGGSFTGVWYSPQWGELHMSQTGAQVIGEYTRNERRGRIQGTVQGNVLRFEWTQSLELVGGRPTTTRGRGYFRYTIGDDGDHYFEGEWGHDDSLTGGGAWNGVRDRRRQPTLSHAARSSSGGDAPVQSADDERRIEDFDTADDGGGSSGGSRSRDSDLDLDGL